MIVCQKRQQNKYVPNFTSILYILNAIIWIFKFIYITCLQKQALFTCKIGYTFIQIRFLCFIDLFLCWNNLRKYTLNQAMRYSYLKITAWLWFVIDTIFHRRFSLKFQSVAMWTLLMCPKSIQNTFSVIYILNFILIWLINHLPVKDFCTWL